MEKYKIKVLKDTPFNKAGTELSISDFRTKYSYICTRDVSDDDLISYLLNERVLSNYYYSDTIMGSWFEVVEISTNNFRIGDWVWHEGLKQAFCVMPFVEQGKKWRPNYVSLEAANTYNIYKRKATQEEINKYDLVSYCDGDVLIGRYNCYYHINTWKLLYNVYANIQVYINAIKSLTFVDYRDTKSSNISNTIICELNGLKVGCKMISHKEVIKIARQLEIIA